MVTPRMSTATFPDPVVVTEALRSELELPGQLDAFCQGGHPRVYCITFRLQLFAFVPQSAQRHQEDLDKLAILQFRFENLVLGEAHIDGDVNHPQIRVTEAGIWT